MAASRPSSGGGLLGGSHTRWSLAEGQQGPGTMRHFDLWKADTDGTARQHKAIPWIHLGVTGKVTCTNVHQAAASHSSSSLRTPRQQGGGRGSEVGDEGGGEVLTFFRDAFGREKAKTRNFAMSTTFRYCQTAAKVCDPSAPSPFAGRDSVPGPWFKTYPKRSDFPELSHSPAPQPTTVRIASVPQHLSPRSKQLRDVEEALVSLGVPADMCGWAAERSSGKGVQGAISFLAAKLGKDDRARLEESMRQRAAALGGSRQASLPKQPVVDGKSQQHQHQHQQQEEELRVGKETVWGRGMNRGIVTRPRNRLR